LQISRIPSLMYMFVQERHLQGKKSGGPSGRGIGQAGT